MMKRKVICLYDKFLSHCLSLLGFASCAGLVACQVEYGPPTDYLAVNPDNIHFSAKGGSATFRIRTDNNWTITAVPAFVVTTPTKGAGSAEVTVETKENTEGFSRSGSIEINSEGNTIVIVMVYQTEQ